MRDKKSTRHAALYIRVSTDAQREEGYSIDAQKEMLKGYCISRQILEYEFYIDGGFTGSNIDRPEMKRLIDEIRSGRVSHVIVYKLDRLSRSQKDTLYLIEDVFNPNDVSFVSLNENMDTSTPIGRAMLGIMSAFAQLERETIRERTRMGMRERVKNGFWPGGGKIPFGYDYDSEKGILVPNEDAEKVRLMYELYLKGWSMMKVASAVGLKYERLAEQVIRRKTNTGIICYKGKEYKGKHEAIVSEETYNAAMEMLEKRSRGGLTTAKSLLSGLVYCGVCGAKMRYQKWGKAGYKIYCYSQDKGKPHLHRSENCDNEKVWASELEDAVIADLFSLGSKDVAGIERLPELDITDMLRKSREQATRRLKNLYKLYSNDSDDALIESISEVKREIEDIEQKLNSLCNAEKSIEAKETRKKELEGISQAWEYMTDLEKQNVVRSYIDKIVVTYNKTDIYYKI